MRCITCLSDVSYESLSGTSVARDFVELPSQLYEHWLEVPEVLERYATHVETGAPMPPEMLDGCSRRRPMTWGFRRWNTWPRPWSIWPFTRARRPTI